MNEKINIKKMDGTTVAADLICFIENITTSKRYIYYTLNEIVGAGESGTVKIYVSKLQQNNPALDTPITDEDWNKLKGYMGDALKGNTNAEIKYVPLSELGEPISISEKAIAMPTSYDYINKQRGVYASSVATMEVAPTVQETPAVPEVAPTIEPTPVAPESPVQAPAPIPETPNVSVEPQVEDPIVTGPTATTQVSTPEPATPVTPPPAPAVEPVVAPEDTASDEEGTGSATLTPIDIAMIEQKYSEMIDSINRLKEQEIEAAKRYNATIELSSMHKEQHANYVQNEQIKESVPEVPTAPTVEPQIPTVEPIAPEPVAVAPETPTMDLGSNPAPIVGAPIEPTPVTPVVPEPVPAAPTDLETNWFDMPANNA